MMKTVKHMFEAAGICIAVLAFGGVLALLLSSVIDNQAHSVVPRTFLYFLP
jgi:hypothetical protein